MKKSLSCLLAIVLMVSMALCAIPAGHAAEDPTVSYIPVQAAKEDSGIALWFDYSSKKICSSETQSSGMDTFAAYMAKNEIENIQFVLYVKEGRTGLTAQITPFVNEAGDSIDSELFIQYYHDCAEHGMVPDAIPPLSAYGAFDLPAGSSQAFLIQLKTAEDTPAGWYSADLTVHNSAGEEVKRATVFAYVWDFALSEETACATSVDLNQSYLVQAHAGTTELSDTELYKVYYDYLLENRISACTLPYSLTRPEAAAYMDNPRVTSFRYPINNTAMMRFLFANVFSGEGGEERFDKAYYFSNVVDAATPADLEALRAHYDQIAKAVSPYTPDYAQVPFWFISTYINDIDYTTPEGETIDQIEYYSDFVNLWCSKTFAFTDKEELSVPGAKVLQPEKWDSVYGTFKERMAEKREDGQKVWWFISWDVEAPYINYYMQTDGTAQRILFWQQFDNDVDGFLYNFANFWLADTADPYENNISNAAYPDAHGESILLYPGSKYGIDGPVGSLRLEAMRDGIEDFQMLTMLEDLQGEGAADALIDQLTTGMVHYSTDAEQYASVRKALGDSVEQALKTESCTHDYVYSVTTPASCTEEGLATYTCRLCGDSYTEVIPKTEHNFVDGVCTVCGASDPSVTPEYVPGDVTGDGRVSIRDIATIRLYMANKLPQGTELTDTQKLAGDVTKDGRITIRDIAVLRLYVAGKTTLN